MEYILQIVNNAQPLAATVAVLSGLALVLGWMLISAQSRHQGDDSALIDAIDALLPQTQCAQCGYPGCRPYAEAVAGGAAIDLCPPGGNATFTALQSLLGRDGGSAPSNPAPLVARIREPECIGCFLCIPACPVDAIIGSPGFMHTVIEGECTGCELCLPACPVDCIDLARPDAAASFSASVAAREDSATQATTTPCIGCNRCEPACPVGLAPRELLWLSTAEKWHAAKTLGLELCIECHRCDRVCPSHIPLAATFGEGKRILSEAKTKQARAAHAKARHGARAARLAAEQQAAQARRAARLAKRITPANTEESVV